METNSAKNKIATPQLEYAEPVMTMETKKGVFKRLTLKQIDKF